ncbi:MULTISPECIES: FadD3 family acyl-CoA ligase [Dietzia]|uniref:FadD3 family acyl-CoA ligase n=1 Tax=Dietzia TaxID=37914 RepID=UPI000D08E9EF|nr:MULTISPECIES: FadD3 family acyl-CoA ligase [Dietzia]AVM64555.1 fatty acid--CoA ligase [Dietzia sp. oral taxon 368]MCT1712962.1 FadD3 family acyl-CoA ligase [Dietzia cinnamea]MCT2275638.1 FadD3 family acyl-CoA ligase [Dietzia cinnamea]
MTTTVETTPVETSPVESTPAALRRAAETWPEREAIADVQPGQHTRWTWSQLLDEVRRFAAGLVARGVEPGDRVVIWAPNTRHWVVASLGVQFAGATMVPANTRYTGSETLEIVQRTNAVAAVVAGAFLGSERIVDLVDAARTTGAAEGPLAGATTLRTIVRIPLDAGDTVRAGAGAAGGVDVLDFDDLRALATDDLLARADARADAVTGDDVADILFTSGTTGKSKGVVALHRQTVAGSRAWGSNNGLTDRDGYLIANPFFHSFGYKAGFLACVLFGVTIVPLSVYSTTETMRLIRDEKITILTGAPTIFQTLLDDPARGDYDLSSLRVAVTGASVVPVALIERMQSDLGLETVITAYGQTETMGFITTTRTGDDDVTVSTTCGRAYPGMEIRIGEHGEILTRGEMVMQGYLDDPENTAKTIDPDGWLHTGDVGEIDADGNLRITDRLKDMYINGGFNVYPAEIEQTLARLDGVVESAVIGVPDDRMGEVGKAFIVRREGSTLTEQDVLDFCREHLANFKRPRTVEFVASLPRNASGKALKTELR